METPNGLNRRVTALEAMTVTWRPDHCPDCGNEHADVVLSLDRIQERHAGRAVDLAIVCACACCAPVLEDLAARYLACGSAA